jgi:hypothetical protein
LVSFEYRSEPPDSIKGADFLERLNVLLPYQEALCLKELVSGMAVSLQLEFQ